MGARDRAYVNPIRWDSLTLALALERCATRLEDQLSHYRVWVKGRLGPFLNLSEFHWLETRDCRVVA